MPTQQIAENTFNYCGEPYKLIHILSGKPPTQVPMAFWRYTALLRSFLKLCFFLTLLLLSFTIILLITNTAVGVRILERAGFVIIGIITGVQGVAYFYGFRYAAGGYQRFLRAHNWSVCPHCGYVLQSLPAVHKCPECGEPYDLDSVQSRWHEWAAMTIAYGRERADL